MLVLWSYLIHRVYTGQVSTKLVFHDMIRFSYKINRFILPVYLLQKIKQFSCELFILGCHVLF